MSKEEPKNPIIIIKKIKKKGTKHHGGSWKIAYADFVTAMMAFFLLMWLLSMLNKYQLEGISQYFKQPIRASLTQRNIDNSSNNKKLTVNANQIKQPNNNKGKTLADLERMKHALEEKFDKNPELRQYKNQLNFIVTADGLKIQLKELNNKPMFSEGQTDFQVYAQEIISWLADELKTVPNQVVIIGHTDSKPYGTDENYTNWELSADRANATRRMLVQNGMPPEKIIRVMGAADVQPLDSKNPENEINRRIEIVVLTDEAVERMDHNSI
jgi:chemotaxis protein MotB